MECFKNRFFFGFFWAEIENMKNIMGPFELYMNIFYL